MALMAMLAACFLDPVLWVVVAVGMGFGARKAWWTLAILVVTSSFIVTEILFLMKTSSSSADFLASWAIRTVAAALVAALQIQIIKWWSARKARAAVRKGDE